MNTKERKKQPAEDLRIEAVMLKNRQPNLMPWARYILGEIQKEMKEEEQAGGARA